MRVFKIAKALANLNHLRTITGWRIGMIDGDIIRLDYQKSFQLKINRQTPLARIDIVLQTANAQSVSILST